MIFLLSHASHGARIQVLVGTEFGYKPVCGQLTTTHYVSTNKIIHLYFSHITYLISYITSLNNTCGWFYKLPHSGL